MKKRTKMKVVIHSKDTYGREKPWKQFIFTEEESLYETKEIAFTHFMWNAIIKQQHGLGHECKYCRDFYDYDNSFNRMRYRGEGIYFKGKRILSLDDLDKGLNHIEIKDWIYFIEK
jgi:hypothetical protein